MQPDIEKLNARIKRRKIEVVSFYAILLFGILFLLSLTKSIKARIFIVVLIILSYFIMLTLFPFKSLTRLFLEANYNTEFNPNTNNSNPVIKDEQIPAPSKISWI